MIQHDPPTDISVRHALSHFGGIWSLTKVLVSAPFKEAGTPESAKKVATPGALVRLHLPHVSVLKEYRRWTGSGVDAGFTLAHLVPQLCLPLMMQALAALPFPATAVLNQVCAVPLPLGLAGSSCDRRDVGLLRAPIAPESLGIS